MMASLLSLPEHFMGELYALLPDAQTRRAFFKEVHDSPAVLHRISMLRVKLPDQGSLHCGSTVEQLLTFPG